MIQEIAVYAIGITIAVWILFRLLRPVFRKSGKGAGSVCSCCSSAATCGLAKELNKRASTEHGKTLYAATQPEECGFTNHLEKYGKK